MVPLPGSPEPQEALPLGGDWMEHGLKEDAGLNSPNNGFMVEEGGPKVCLSESGASLHLLHVCIASLLVPVMFPRMSPGYGAARSVKHKLFSHAARTRCSSMCLIVE